MTFHTRGQFIEFCHRVFGYYKLTNSGDNINVVCPFCAANKGVGYSKQKLVIQTETHIGHCWSCGYKFPNLIPILRKYFPYQEETYKEKFHKSETLHVKKEEEEKTHVLNFPEGYTLLATADDKDPYVKTALDYLKFRKMDLTRDLWYWKLGVTTHEKDLFSRIIVPSFDADGVFNFFSARAWYKNPKRKYNNPRIPRENIIFNEINLNWKEEIVIVEGAFDLMKCSTNATCLLGSELTANYRLFQEIVLNKTPVILALDPDAMKKTMRLAERLFEFDVQVKILDVPEHFEDVGDMTKDEFISILDDANIFDIDYSLRKKILGII